MIRLVPRKLLLLAGGALALLLAIVLTMLSSNPDELGARGVTGFFLLIYLFIAFVVEIGLQLVARYHPRYNFVQRPHMILTLLLAGLPTLIIALSSLRQLHSRDVIISIVLAGTLVFYWSKRA